jgi:hypothetical protein
VVARFGPPGAAAKIRSKKTQKEQQVCEEIRHTRTKLEKGKIKVIQEQ